jgi:geranylgeranyl pyrophosphate synthase
VAYSKPKISFEELSKMSRSCEVDAFKLVENDICSLSDGIKDLLGSDHPVLEACARYFFEIDGGKKIRPTMVLAVSHALNSQPSVIQSRSVLNGVNGHNSSNNSNSSSTNNSPTPKVSPSQKRLAEITEMIHTASLFHDDVIDKVSAVHCSTDRGRRTEDGGRS